MSLHLVDNWKPQLEAVKRFLESNGVRTGRVTWRKASVNQVKKGARGAYVLRVSNSEGILIAARKMLPYALKKEKELRIVVDYNEDRISGDEAIAMANEDVMSGKRTGKIRHSNLPFTRSQGKELKDTLLMGRLQTRNTTHVPEEILARMTKDYYENRLSLRDISKTFCYSLRIVRRVLGRPH